MVGIAVLATLLYGGLFFPWRRAIARARRWVTALQDRRRAHPAGRPIEQIAWHARRLGAEYRHQPRGLSFVKYEAHRRAYDDVLAEGCCALGLDHLLRVLPPGPELDLERSRVEVRLELAGLDLGIPFT